MQNYYQILGVNKDASLDEIKKAYLKQMKKYHPDVYSGDTEYAQKKTTELNVIYSTLKQSAEREKYDRKIFGEKPKPQEQVEEAPNIFSSMWSRLKRNFEDSEIKYKPSKEIINPKKEKPKQKTKNKDKKQQPKPQKSKTMTAVEKTELQKDETQSEIDKEKAKLYISIGVIVGAILLIIILFLIF